MLSWYIGGLNFQIKHHLFSNIYHVEKTTKKFGLKYNVTPAFLRHLYYIFVC